MKFRVTSKVDNTTDIIIAHTVGEYIEQLDLVLYDKGLNQEQVKIEEVCLETKLPY